MNRNVFILASMTIVIWASSFAGVRVSLLGGYSPSHLVLIRFLVASGVFLVYSMLPGVRFQRPEKRDIVSIFILGFLGITIYHVGLTFGVQTITAGTASMIVGSAPIFTAAIAFLFLKERLSLISWIGLGVGFIGMILIMLGTADQTFSISKGVYFIIIATISTSAFFVFQKSLLTKYKPIELTAYFTWAGTLPMLIFLPGITESIQAATLEAHVAAIFVGIFPAATAYALWATALSLGKTSSVASMLYIEPAIAIVIAWFWLNEWPSTLSIIGGAIAISSVCIVNFVGRKQNVKN